MTQMTYLIVKYLVTAAVVVVVSEVAKRGDKAGALIASLPMVTVMTMVWLYAEGQGSAKIANHAYYTFWFVLPTLPMFLLMPWMMNRGIAFGWSLAAGSALTMVLFGALALVMRRYGVGLM